MLLVVEVPVMTVYFNVIKSVKLVIFQDNVLCVNQDIMYHLRLILIMFNVKNVILNVVVVKIAKTIVCLVLEMVDLNPLLVIANQDTLVI